MAQLVSETYLDPKAAQGGTFELDIDAQNILSLYWLGDGRIVLSYLSTEQAVKPRQFLLASLGQKVDESWIHRASCILPGIEKTILNGEVVSYYRDQLHLFEVP
jgi:hypothetical protein